MAIAINIKKECPAQEVSSVIKSALLRDSHVAAYKEKRYTGICKRFEKKYGMDSDEFMDKLESGVLDDRDDYFDWFAAKKGLDIWSRRLRILAGVNLWMMNVRGYYASLQAMIRNCPFIAHWNTEFEEIDLQVGYFKGMLEFIDDSTLYFIEFVEIYGDSDVEARSTSTICNQRKAI